MAETFSLETRRSALLAGARENITTTQPDAASYTVVARRYRPQRFEDVVGQDHVVQALRNAINQNRVTHAYLFSGTRGVGKTSIARIFAKCLNCVKGPTAEPCLVCDICQAIAVGQDVDVIEIDGASNNGVDAVRELRQNAGLRPSRSHFKIYYIDEVHMLSTGAFNALLKTLEEPPEHVKFFFATTEPNKIPITVLSRCQRYDFAGISPEQTVSTLAEICKNEGIQADEDALRAIARRSSGSMRDAQSLLEQLLSFGGERLTVELVLRSLGLASDDRTLDLLDALSRRDPAEALTIADAAVSQGVQPSELLGGVLDFLRDAMVLSAGADISLLAAGARQRPRLTAIVDRWPLDTILAAQQILAETRGRVRGSPHVRLLVELALVRVARLENLVDLGELVAKLSSLEAGLPSPGPSHVEKKKRIELQPPARLVEPLEIAGTVPEPEPSRPGVEPVLLTPPAWEFGQIQASWPVWATNVEVATGLKMSSVAPLAISGPKTLVLCPVPGYTWVVDRLDAVESRAKWEPLLSRWFGRAVDVKFDRPIEAPSETSRNALGPKRDSVLNEDPLVRKIVELFEARPIRIELEDA